MSGEFQDVPKERRHSPEGTLEERPPAEAKHNEKPAMAQREGLKDYRPVEEESELGNVVIGLPVDSDSLQEVQTEVPPLKRRSWLCCAVRVLVLLTVFGGLICLLILFLQPDTPEDADVDSEADVLSSDSFSVGGRMRLTFVGCSANRLKLVNRACYKMLRFGLAGIDADANIKRSSISVMYEVMNWTNDQNVTSMTSDVLVTIQVDSRQRAEALEERLSAMSFEDMASHVNNRIQSYIGTRFVEEIMYKSFCASQASRGPFSSFFSTTPQWIVALQESQPDRAQAFLNENVTVATCVRT